MDSASVWRPKGAEKYLGDEGQKEEKGSLCSINKKIEISERNHNCIKNLSLAKLERLSGRKEIRFLFAKGKRFSGEKLLIIYQPDREQKAGFVASRNVGSATKRNRVKRIIREAYRMNKGIFKGLKVVFYAQALLDQGDVLNVFQAFQRTRCKE